MGSCGPASDPPAQGPQRRHGSCFTSGMDRSPRLPHAPKHDSWLSLVAETAGAFGCSIVRVRLSAQLWGSRDRRVIVQVLSETGRVIGASTWSGPATQLRSAATVDVGYWGANDDERLRVVAWLDPSDVGTDPYFADPPAGVTAAWLTDSQVRLVLDEGIEAAA